MRKLLVLAMCSISIFAAALSAAEPGGECGSLDGTNPTPVDHSCTIYEDDGTTRFCDVYVNIGTTTPFDCYRVNIIP